MQGTFKDEFQRSSAWCLATDFNSFQQNCCGAAGAGDFEATRPEGSLDEYLNRGQGFIFLPKGCLSPPASTALFIQLFASSKALELVCVPMGY